MRVAATIQDTEDRPGRGECWCCGCQYDSTRMVHLGNHPEVAVCIRCAYSLKTWAWELEDRSRTGAAVQMRNGFRTMRRRVIVNGLHQKKWVGRPLRWLGRKLP